MIRKGLFFIIAFGLSLPLFAQNHSVGILLGTSEYIEEGIEADLGLDVKEIWYTKELDIGTSLRFKLGQADIRAEEEESALPVGEHEVEYGLLLAEYRFDEIFGSTTLFFGPGAYRQTVGDDDETNFGLSGGVSGDFPVTRRFGFILEAAYHWVNFDEEYDFLTVGAGVRVSF